MAALWGGGAGHAGAGGTLLLRGAAEPSGGNALPSTQYLLADNLHLSLEALEAETTVEEAEELLGTVQDYLDTSVISIIEDLSSLTEAKGCADADNELSLLTAITEILDSTDDESLSPFDTIPDSELLTSLKEPDNSSFQRYLSLSRTPPKQDIRSLEDFQEPRICAIMTEKVEACATSLPLALTLNCPKDRTASNKASSKGSCGEWRVFRHRERDTPILQRSDGEEEEEEEEITDCGLSFLVEVNEIPAASATKEEVEKDLPTSDGLYTIAPERISLSELVRSMHPYCQPDFTESQPLPELRAICPVVLPDVGDGVEIPAVPQNVDAELSYRTDSSSTSGQAKEADLLVSPLDKVLCTDDAKTADMDRGLALDSKASGGGTAVLQRKEAAPLGPTEEAVGSMNDHENTPQNAPGAPRNIKPSALVTDKRSGNIKKNGKKFSKEKRRHKEDRNDRPVKQTSAKPSTDEKQVEKAGGRNQTEPSPDQASYPGEQQDAIKEEKELFKHGAVLKSKNPLMVGLESAEEHPSTQNQGNTDALPADQESNHGGKAFSTSDEMSGRDASPLLPGSIVDISVQPPTNDLSSKISHSLKETKPRPLSLSEYRQRRKQRQPTGEGTSSTAEKRSASKWPSLPEPPMELADLPCLLVPPPPPKPSVPEPEREPGKPASAASTPVPASKATTIHLSVQTTAAPVLPPCSETGTVSTAPLPAPAPVVPSQPSTPDTFPPLGAQVPPILPPAYFPSPPGNFLPAPSNSCIFSAPPPVPPWALFAPPVPGYKMPPSSSATEVCSAAFHPVPPVPPPTWPLPPVPLPPFGPGLPYNSVDWAAGPPSPYWPGIQVPPPVLPIPYGDQGVYMQKPPVGSFLIPPFSEETPGQQSTAPTQDSSHFRIQNLAPTEKASTPAQLPWVEPPSTVRTASRRISDPRRQALPAGSVSKAEATPGKPQPLGKLLSPTSVVEPLGKPALTQPAGKTSVLQPSGEPHPVLPSQQDKESIGKLKSLEEPFSAEPVEKAHIVPVAVQGAQEAPPADQSQEELPSLTATLVLKELTVPAAVQMDAKEAAPVDPSPPPSAGPQKMQDTGPLSKTSTHTLKQQPLISIAQSSCNKDIVEAFITEIGIEASDLSSLLEQFEQIEAKERALDVVKSKGSIATENSGSEAQQEKKMVDWLQAPELTNIAGLTPPATPPHQLWKPLSAVSLLGKAGSPKGSRPAKSLSRPHRKAAPFHVGSGEHDYCQLSAAPPKGGSRWNIKRNTDITIKPIKALIKQDVDQPATSQPLAAAAAATTRVTPVATDSLVAACQNPKEAVSPVDACKDPTQVFNHVKASSGPGGSGSEGTLTRPCTEPLDYRTSTPRFITKSSEDPCSVLLSPAASPYRDAKEPASQQPQDVQQKFLASRHSLRCYRSSQKSTSPQKRSWRGRHKRASRSFSSSSDSDSDSSSSDSSSYSSSSSSRSRSPPSKRWRRCRSRSSCSSSTSRSRSRSRSRCSSYLSKSSLRSPSPDRRSTPRKRYDSSSSRDHYQREKISDKERAIEERRVVFIGKIPSRMTRSELRHRFSVFGDIENCTLHFREQGDNYGFVTYRYAEEAFAAIEGGHSLHHPDEQPFDLCFGGRRQFCKRSYTDLDSNIEDFDPAPVKNKFDSLDFDTLLKQAQQSLRR